MLLVNGESERNVVRPEDDHLLFVDKDRSSSETKNDCLRALSDLKNNGDDSLFNGVSFVLHRNGEPDYCGLIESSFDALEQALEDINGCEIDKFDRYSIESFLTTLFINLLGREGNSCGSNDNSTALGGLEGFCDMSKARTVKQPDFDSLDRLRSGSLPCRSYTREGLRIDSLSTLTDIVRKGRRDSSMSCLDHVGGQACFSTPSLHLYAVPAGRFFVFAPAMVGEKFIVDHVPNASTLVVETLSLSPRVFELYSFFSSQEAESLVEEALAETSETHKLHRSTTGATNGKVYSYVSWLLVAVRVDDLMYHLSTTRFLVSRWYRKRTSDNAWITDSELALRIKKYVVRIIIIRTEIWRELTFFSFPDVAWIFSASRTFGGRTRMAYKFSGIRVVRSVTDLSILR
jgi:hypothetical protein